MQQHTISKPIAGLLILLAAFVLALGSFAGSAHAALPHHPSLAEYSLAELQVVSGDLSENGTGSEYYSEFTGYLQSDAKWTSPTLVGLGSYPAEDQVMVCRIIGICHDDLADGSGKKAGLTLMASHSLPIAYGSGEELYDGGWPATTLRPEMNSGEIWDMMPAALQDAIAPVFKTSSTSAFARPDDDPSSIATTTETLFIPSLNEIYGEDIFEYYDYNEGDSFAYFYPLEGSQYEWFAYGNRIELTEYYTPSAYTEIALRTDLTHANSGTRLTGDTDFGDGASSSDMVWTRTPTIVTDGLYIVDKDGKIDSTYAEEPLGVNPVFAIKGTFPQPAADPAQVVISHAMETSPAVDLSGIAYTITPTPITTLTSAQENEGGRAVPTGTGGVTISPIAIAPASATAAAGSTQYTKVYESGALLGDMFGSADSFGLPGVYFFDISETAAGGSSSDTSIWSYGGEQYRMRVYVVNDEDNPGSLKYDAFTVTHLVESQGGGMEEGLKVDGGAMSFTSSYTAYQPLVVTKEVEGSFGNTAYDFPFEVTLVLPEWYDSAAPIASVNATQVSAPARTGDTGPFTAVYTADLHDGESATFTVPVGTCYKVDEKSPIAGSSAVLDAAGVSYDVEIDWTVDTGLPPVGDEVEVSIYAPGGQLVDEMTISELKAVSSVIAADGDWQVHADKANNYADPDTATAAGLYASYMTGDYSFVFSDDPNPTPMEYMIVGINHYASDNASTNEMGLTFMARHALDKGYWMNPESEALTGGWAGEGNDLRLALNDPASDIGSLLPPCLFDGGAKANVVKHSNGEQSDGGNSADLTSTDRFWLASCNEIGGAGSYDISANAQYELFAYKGITRSNLAIADMILTMDGDFWEICPAGAIDRTGRYWTRSTMPYTDNIYMAFVSESPSSNRFINTSPAYSLGIWPVFCV